MTIEESTRKYVLRVRMSIRIDYQGEIDIATGRGQLKRAERIRAELAKAEASWLAHDAE